MKRSSPFYWRTLVKRSTLLTGRYSVRRSLPPQLTGHWELRWMYFCVEWGYPASLQEAQRRKKALGSGVSMGSALLKTEACPELNYARGFCLSVFGVLSAQTNYPICISSSENPRCKDAKFKWLVILRDIDFLLKICWSIPCLHPSWKVHTWH